MLETIQKLTHQFLLLTRKYPVFFSVIFLSMAIGEVFPFSMYPMYNNFPKESYTFFFKNKSGVVLKSSDVSFGGISHIVDAEASKRHLSMGEVSLNPLYQKELTEQVAKIYFSPNNFNLDTLGEVSFYVIKNHLVHGKVTPDTSLISTYHVE